MLTYELQEAQGGYGNCRYLSPRRLVWQNTTGWVTYKQQKFISHGSGGWKRKIKASGGQGSVSDENPFLAGR